MLFVKELSKKIAICKNMQQTLVKHCYEKVLMCYIEPCSTNAIQEQIYIKKLDVLFLLGNFVLICNKMFLNLNKLNSHLSFIINRTGVIKVTNVIKYQQ